MAEDRMLCLAKGLVPLAVGCAPLPTPKGGDAHGPRGRASVLEGAAATPRTPEGVAVGGGNIRTGGGQMAVSMRSAGRGAGCLDALRST